MNTYFDKLLVEFFSRKLSEPASRKNKTIISKNKVSDEFKDILDRMATELVVNTFDNKRLVEAVASLPKMGRTVLVFCIVLDMEMSEIAYLLDTTIESVYVQKCKAVKKLREYMNDDQKM